MEDSTSKQELKVRWTKLLKPIFKTKANRQDPLDYFIEIEMFFKNP